MLDLKGPLPRIVKVGNSQASIRAKKGQKVQLINEKRHFEDEDFIQIDHKVLNILEPGDRLQFENSQLVLEVEECRGVRSGRRHTNLNPSNLFPSSPAVTPSTKKTKSKLKKDTDDTIKEQSTDNVISSEEENQKFFSGKKEDSYDKMITDCLAASKKKAKNKPKRAVLIKTSFDANDPSTRTKPLISKTSKTMHCMGKKPKHRATCKVIRGGVLRPLMKIYVSGKDLLEELDLKCVTGKEVVDVSRGTENVFR